MPLLDSHAVLVTGAARGIGKAIALRAAAEGAELFVTDRDVDGLAETERAITANGGKTHSLTGSLSHPEFITRLGATIQERLGRLDVVVNNAGIGYRASVADHTLESWNKVLAINLTAPFLIVKAVLPLLEASGRGAIVNMASTAVAGFGGQVAYDSSKGGILSMTRSMAVDLGCKGIRANAVCPGFIATELVAAEPDYAQLGQRFCSKLPVARMGQPEEIAAAVVWLASKEASYVTGQGIFVDGGWIRS